MLARPLRPLRRALLLLLAPLVGAALPSVAAAQSFYVTGVAWEGVAPSATSGLEAALPEVARGCARAGSARRLAIGQRVVIVRIGADGAALGVEVRSDDVSPSRTEEAFGRCLERALALRRYERPEAQPASIEVRLDYARAVPEALGPGGAGVARGPRVHEAPPAPSAGLPPEQVRQVAEAHADDVGRCVRESVDGARILAGRVELDVTLAGDGRVELVSLVSSTTSNAAFDRCVVESVRGWRFPAPGARVAIRYPLVVSSDVAEPAR